ncbi:helix-turn-helix domain-containing protein [Bordetella genomosp. 13]|uniref:helix-turn-helix domain-containing protein n=1 Tax=Bordetella genomosp. 13 TaxID=463040 RepID=UPI00391FBEE0
MTIGLRLRECRLTAGLSQEDLGIAIGIDRNLAGATIDRYESGVIEPQSDVVISLANAMGVRRAYFYCADDELAQILMKWERVEPDVHCRLTSFINVLEKE